jgi:cysteine desulfurase
MSMSHIYLDYNASYPSTPAHVQAVCSLLSKDFGGNPSSIHHFGRSAKLLMEQTREKLAKLLGGEKHDIIFTSGASEANNLVAQGVIRRALKTRPEGPVEVLYSAGEHPSLIEPIVQLAQEGRCIAREIGVNHFGQVDEEALLGAITAATVLVAVCQVQGEIGCCNGVNSLARRAKKINPELHFHVDGVQGFGKLASSWVGSSAVDSFALSGHKIGAFKGIGALWLRPRAAVQATTFGGGQERSLRPGTENIPGIISLGLRAEYLLQHPEWMQGARGLMQEFWQQLQTISGVVVHGELREYSSCVNFHIEGKEADLLLLRFDMAGICVSSGTACASGERKPSGILRAMGYSPEVAANSLRLSFGEETNAAEVAAALALIRQLAG